MTYNLNIPVCTVPEGNGVSVETISDILRDEDFNNTSPHIHSFYEILWFKEGTGVHTIDFHNYDVVPNTIFFISPGQVHHFDHNDRYDGVSIKMCTDFMKNEQNPMLKYNVFNSFDSIPYYIINDNTATELDLLVHSLTDEAGRSDEFGNVEILQSQLRIFLIKVQRHGIQDGSKRLDLLKPSHRLFMNFRRMVDQEYMHMHTVQEYASQLNVAIRTLNKCVNECSGMSPLAFINERIMLESKRMVRYGNMMIKEIAFTLGYDDPSYFVKFFKRQTGYLPSDFRELDN